MDQQKGPSQTARPYDNRLQVWLSLRQDLFKLRQFLRGDHLGVQIAEDDAVFLVGDLPPHQNPTRILGGKLDRLCRACDRRALGPTAVGILCALNFLLGHCEGHIDWIGHAHTLAPGDDQYSSS